VTAADENDASQPADSHDEFDEDFDALRSMPNLEDALVERILLSVPVRRPGRTEFFRVHPDPAYTLDAYTLEREEGFDRVTYWVAATMRNELLDHLQPTRLFTCMSKSGITFLWPAKLPTGDSNAGRAWRVSALAIAEKAKTHWVRMHGNRDLGAYDLFAAKGKLDEPVWRDEPLRELVKLAFKGRVIDSADHQVVREINGYE